MSGEGLCNWEQLENHSGPHISVLLVLEEVAVGLGFLEVRELPGPSNLFLRVCKMDTGSIRILSTLDWLEGSQHQKSRIQQVGFDLLRNCSGLHTFHCQ